MQNLIENWAQAEITASNGAGTNTSLSVLQYKTSTLQIPSNLPTIFAGTPGVMRFPLSQMQPGLSGFENAILEIEIQIIGTNIYKINRPRVVGGTRAFSINSLYLLIKSSEDENILGLEDTSYTSNWHNVQAQSIALALPSPLPSGPMKAAPLVDSPIYYKAHLGSDYLRIGFVDIH